MVVVGGGGITASHMLAMTFRRCSTLDIAKCGPSVLSLQTCALSLAVTGRNGKTAERPDGMGKSINI